MPTRLMLIRDSAPMPGARVKIKGVEGDFRSDDDGMVEVPVETDTFSVAVHDTEDWIVKKVRRTNPSSMVVVDLSEGGRQRKRWDLTERYTFQQVLGRGGMGVVVRATDNVLERPVAIKMLSDEFLENEEAQELFMTEGRAMATLSHPNLVTVHDVTRASGRVLMVIEFVDGQNVETLLNERGVLTAAEALSVTIQVLKALEYLHTQGVIHRDLKPGNFMVNDAGTVKVIDFGLARSLEDMWDKGTRVRGTPAYMAPEQIRGEQMSAATDIYQMGVSFWELLTGELPYSGEQLYAHVHEKVPRLLDVDKTADPELDEVLWACLQKDPLQRPQSTAALRARLESVYHRLATDPNLGTAATAHIVESGLGRNGRSTEALMPRTPSDLGTHPSGSQRTSGGVDSQPHVGEDELDEDKRRVPIWAVLLLVLGAAGAAGAYATGAFSGGEVDTPVAAVEAPEEPAPPPADETPPVESVEPDLATAFTLAQRTIGSSVSASRAGTDVVGQFRRAANEENERRESRKPAKVERKPGKVSASDTSESALAESPTPNDEAPKVDEAAAAAPTKEPADEPAVFEPRTFAPTRTSIGSAAQKDPKKTEAEKKEASKQTTTKKPDSKPARKEKETKTEVPVSF